MKTGLGCHSDTNVNDGSIVNIQLSEKQPKGPWTDIFGKRHDASESCRSFDFIVRFDDGVIAMCTSPLDSVTGDFEVVAPNP